ncbi:hypothetical protein [Kitasatospora sp. NPDC088783]|uniref:hypothetical protein n=1 Tax=Kitasatospora sp. NPDC088783 TaxID=3364077 RepID=UPI00381E078D
MPTVLGIALLAPAVLGTWTSEAGTTRGGEVHNELRLSVSTNAGTDPGVRLRAGEPATRTYHLSNHAEYPLGSVVLSDPQLPGGRLSCGADRSIPPGDTLDCTATFTVAAGPQTAQVAAVADAPDHLPQAHAEAPTGYLGIAAGIRLTRVGTPGGTGLSRRSAPRTPPSDLRGSILESTRASAPGSAIESATGTASGPTAGAATRPATRAVAGVGGTVELQYRLEAFGDVPITAASVTEGLPGLSTVDCAGPDGGHTLSPGQAVDCRATGTARPGRQTGTARAVGLADDATVGPDGNRQAPRQVSAVADGAYDGLRPTPSRPEPTEPAPVGQGVGSGPGAGGGSGEGSGTGTGPGTTPGSGPVTGPGAGAGAGAGAGQGQGGGAAAGAGPAAPGTTGTGGTAATGTAPALSNDAVPPGLFPVSVPPGTRPEAAAVGQQPGVAGQAQPAAGAPALAGQLLVPFLPGQAPVLLPGGTAFARPASPFAAPGRSGAANPFSGNPAASTTDSRIASALASSSVLASTPASGPSRETDRASGTAVGRQPSAPATGRSPGMQAQSQFAEEDWPRGDEDDTWDGAEVMMLLLAILLPVLCVLAAAFTARNRGRRGRP